jgi:hypothetical protein
MPEIGMLGAGQREALLPQKGGLQRGPAAEGGLWSAAWNLQPRGPSWLPQVPDHAHR